MCLQPFAVERPSVIWTAYPVCPRPPEIMSLLSPREWAIIAWLVIFFIWALLKESIRRSTVLLCRSLLEWKILAALGLVVFYAGTVVFLYRVLDLNYSRIWIDAGLWVFYGFFLAGRYVSKREYANVWHDVFRENVTAVVFLELVINTYTFTFAVEMVLVPVIVTISMFGAVAEARDRFKPVDKLTDWALALIGFGILGYATFQAIENPGALKNVDTLSAISLPIVLTVGFAPFIYLLLIFSHYEHIFMRLDMGKPKSSRLKLRAKWELFKSLNLSYSRLNSFVSSQSAALMRVTSIEDVRELVQKQE